jgi:hypothetical protein
MKNFLESVKIKALLVSPPHYKNQMEALLGTPPTTLPISCSGGGGGLLRILESPEAFPTVKFHMLLQTNLHNVFSIRDHLPLTGFILYIFGLQEKKRKSP